MEIMKFIFNMKLYSIDLQRHSNNSFTFFSSSSMYIYISTTECMSMEISMLQKKKMP